jgi:luciferase family oxidoreductase group 1
VKLSVLDQSPIRAGGTPAQAVAETLELARAADRLGYETFCMLETLYPGCIDLGIGRAPGSDQRTASALQHGSDTFGIEHFPAQIAELLAFLADALPANHPFAGVHAMPTGEGVPEFWLLGSSDQSAAYAAYFGCAFSFAHFITDEGGTAVMDAYRRHFRPQGRLAAPQGRIGVFVLCAESEAAAQRLASSRDLWRLRLDQGILGPIPPVEEALAHEYSASELTRIAYNRRRQVVGRPAQVRERLIALTHDYDVDELVVVSICFDFAARMRSYELLAEAFELPRRS